MFRRKRMKFCSLFLVSAQTHASSEHHDRQAYLLQQNWCGVPLAWASFGRAAEDGATERGLGEAESSFLCKSSFFRSAGVFFPQNSKNSLKLGREQANETPMKLPSFINETWELKQQISETFAKLANETTEFHHRSGDETPMKLYETRGPAILRVFKGFFTKLYKKMVRLRLCCSFRPKPGGHCPLAGSQWARPL